MVKNISIILIGFLFFVFGIDAKSYAQPMKNPAFLKEQMQGHIDKMRIKSPQKYQAMIQRAVGNITQCTDCHQEVLKGNFPSQKGMDSKSPLIKKK